jgi:primosomal protein N' (replication factor Y) (superfamily II helicase)
MKFYSIFLPVQTSLTDIIYQSEQPICQGARVIVQFNRKIMTGICNREVASTEISASIAYKQVLEILDECSILPHVLLELADWMGKYYRCSAGKAAFAMLPSVLLPEIATQLRWLAADEPALEFASLYNSLQDRQFHQVAEIRKSYDGKTFFKTLEAAEAHQLVEIKRSFDSKVKPKTVNYLKLLVPNELPELTPKQTAAWQTLSALGTEFPLKDITDAVSYSVLKALVAKRLVEIIPHQAANRTVMFPEHRTHKKITLTPEQYSIISAISASPEQPGVHLIYGITGSGKTEVYIEVIKFYLERGQNIILLIPEISLTPQMVDRFFSAFGSTIAILHSQLTERQRFEQWQLIRQGDCRIVIGARSAIFAPLEKVGLIIVDEEHEPSYKQENAPRYNGRDLAIVRARLEGAAVILGSATPSLESWYNVEQGRYQKHLLMSRPTPQGLPEVQILDLRDEEEVELLSVTLRDAIQQCLDRSEQVILFQNRRGFASFIQCKNCGILQQCPNCEISLYFHHDRDAMVCHYCGYQKPVPRKCPSCGSYTFSFGAPGTQKIEQLLKIYFPTARILRLDSDSSRRKDSYTYMYDMMHKREIDILLGTQMVSKGLDFPNVTLVGVVLADISLNIPDFRAAERTFNLLTQVAGRSGRGEQPGKVIIQTWNPGHYAIRYACAQDYVNFAQEELQYRQRLFYPPFYRLGRFIFSCLDEQKLKAALNAYRTALDKLALKYQAPNLILLGPVPAPMSKINKLYRWHLICKAIDAETLSRSVQELESLLILPTSISVAIDIDPLSLM